MSRAIEQKKNQEGFVKPGELVDLRGGASLSMQDRRVFNHLIEHAWPEIGKDTTHKIPMARLRGTHKGSERIEDSVKTLMATLVEIPTKIDDKPAMFATQLLGETTRTIDEESPNAVLLYSFPPGLRRIIQDSRYWGRIKLFVMMSYTSKYGLALYEALCLRGNLRTNEQTFSVEDFRELLGVEKGKMPLYKNLNKWAIEPAVREVNGVSDFNVTIEAVREGGQVRGKITGFRLSWEKKTHEEWIAALDEQMRSKVGRRARLAGTVETVAA